jgi:hypothetical protein
MVKKLSWRLAKAGVAILLASSLPALAQGPGWTANSTIVRIVDTSNGGINIRLSPDVTGCTSQSGYGSNYASVYPDHPGLNRIKATLLTAYSTGATVSVYLSDGTCRIAEVILGGW